LLDATFKNSLIRELHLPLIGLVYMKNKLTLEIETDIDQKTSRVGISKKVTIADRRGSNLSGSTSLIPGCDSYQMPEKEVAVIEGDC
jgi:hypothetical protein